MARLRRTDRIEHYRHSSARGIFHSYRNIKSACGKPVLLILYRASADRNIRQEIGQIAVIFGVQHFVSTGKAGLLYGVKMKLSYLDKSLKHILGLMYHTLVAFTCCTGLVRVNSRYNQYLVLYLLLNGYKP